jgi:hypothetical protein
MSFDVFLNSIGGFSLFSRSGVGPEMSSDFEYRRLATAYLDLAKRTGVPADKTRLARIAEAWLDLADRVTRNRGKAKRGNVDPVEHPTVSGTTVGSATLGSTIGTSNRAPAFAPSRRHAGLGRFDTEMQ